MDSMAFNTAFQDQLLHFIGQLSGAGAAVQADTPLLEGGLIDSRRVVDLIEFVEHQLGLTVPDHKLSMEFFRTPATIVREFAATRGVQE
jgi:acyl carrier protein